MTAFYGDFDRAAQEEESLKTIAKALEMGINLLDLSGELLCRIANYCRIHYCDY